MQGLTPFACRQALPLASRKGVIIQRGGFLLPLLSAVLPALASLLFGTRDK